MSAALLLLLAGLLAFAESAIGLGVVLPGETAIVALASVGSVPVVPLVLVVAVGATAGDHVGYLMGRRWGPRLAGSKVVARVGIGRWQQATDLLRRHGVSALLVTRLVPVLRTVMPAVAGAAEMSYPRFAIASVIGAMTWASLWVLAGATLGALSQLSRAAILIAAVVAGATVAVVIAWRQRAPEHVLPTPRLPPPTRKPST